MSQTTINESKFLEQFSTERKAVAFFEKFRWPDGRHCPYCGSLKTYPHKGRNFYYHCRESGCRRQFSCKTNTVMQSSKLPVKMWLYAMYKVSVARKDISSLQLAKDLGITQKSAWFMLQKIKEACRNNPDMLSGIVEVDETHVGVLEKNKHESKKLQAGRGVVGKSRVPGMRKRGSKTKAEVIEKQDVETLESEINRSVVKDSVVFVVFTDEHKGYSGLLKQEFEHDMVNNSAKEYVKDMASTDEIESVWAVLKRSITETYHHVSKKHLHRYVNETTFRLNESDVRNMLMARIVSLCSKTVGKTSLYNKLIRENA